MGSHNILISGEDDPRLGLGGGSSTQIDVDGNLDLIKKALEQESQTSTSTPPPTPDNNFAPIEGGGEEVEEIVRLITEVTNNDTAPIDPTANLDQQLAISQLQFDTEQDNIQSRLDQVLALSQSQFEQQQAGVTDRFNVLQRATSPFLETGTRGVESLNELAQNPNLISQTPGFQFRFQQGQQATENAAASRGAGLGGNVLLALQQQGQGLASEELQNEFTRRLQTTAVGLSGLESLGLAQGRAGTEATAGFSNLSGATQGAFQDAGNQANNAFNNLNSTTNRAFNNLTNSQINQSRIDADFRLRQLDIDAARRLGNQNDRTNTTLGIIDLIGTFLGSGSGQGLAKEFFSGNNQNNGGSFNTTISRNQQGVPGGSTTPNLPFQQQKSSPFTTGFVPR